MNLIFSILYLEVLPIKDKNSKVYTLYRKSAREEALRFSKAYNPGCYFYT